MISVDDYLFFVDEALDAMIGIVEGLGDEAANLRLDIEGSNSPFAILTHCLGVMEYWAGHVVAGRSINRDRDAEFHASGAVPDLVQKARAARAQLADDLSAVAPLDAPGHPASKADAQRTYGRTQGGVLVHLYKELAQHRGQMEVCRDVITAPWARLVRQT
jgi:uncharacterized damage-inducible protein DinB